MDVGTRLNYPTPGPGDLQPRRPYPLLAEGFGDEQRGWSRWNAMTITVHQQVTHGLQVYGQGTIQHSYGNAGYIDPYNLDYSNGTLSLDTAHQLSASVIYDTPGLQSRPWLMRKALGGWQASSIVALRGGLPFSVNSSQVMNDDIDGSRADYVTTNGPAALPNGQRTINQWFNTAAFTTPANYTWGNSGLNILRGPGKAEVELAVQKSFPVRERANIIFRAEAQNALNRVNLGQPTSTVGNAAYGTIRSLGGDPRLMQMMMKITF
jgi:hypothetical protein